MDNTLFSSLTSTITTDIGYALSAVMTVCALILGAQVGYRLYLRFTDGSDGDGGNDSENDAKWEEYYDEHGQEIEDMIHEHELAEDGDSRDTNIW